MRQKSLAMTWKTSGLENVRNSSRIISDYICFFVLFVIYFDVKISQLTKFQQIHTVYNVHIVHNVADEEFNSD